MLRVWKLRQDLGDRKYLMVHVRREDPKSLGFFAGGLSGLAKNLSIKYFRNRKVGLTFYNGLFFVNDLAVL